MDANTGLIEALDWAVRELAGHSASPRADAERLMQAAADVGRAAIFAYPERKLGTQAAARLTDWVLRRREGEPVAYLLGQRGFWTLDLAIGPGVLIPRPETELLVEHALAAIPAGQPASVLDLGTGSGAIALALATERPQWTITATDQSTDALQIATRNAQRCHTRNISFLHGDWYAALATTARFDLIISNPPYIAAADPHLHEGDLRFEPHQALASGPDGLDALRSIIGQAPDWLNAGGRLAVEHGYDQQTAVQALFAAAGFVNIRNERDLGQQPRVCAGTIR